MNEFFVLFLHVVLIFSFSGPVDTVLSQSNDGSCRVFISEMNTRFYNFINATLDRGPYTIDHITSDSQQFLLWHKKYRPVNDYFEFVKICSSNAEENKSDQNYGFVIIEIDHFQNLKPVILQYFKFNLKDFVSDTFIVGTVNNENLTPHSVKVNALTYGSFLNDHEQVYKEIHCHFSQKVVVLLFKLNNDHKWLEKFDIFKLFLSEEQFDSLIKSAIETIVIKKRGVEIFEEWQLLEKLNLNSTYSTVKNYKNSLSWCGSNYQETAASPGEINCSQCKSEQKDCFKQLYGTS